MLLPSPPVDIPDSPWSCPPDFVSGDRIFVLADLEGPSSLCPLESWLAHWQMLAMHRPQLTKLLLFKLGIISSHINIKTRVK